MGAVEELILTQNGFNLNLNGPGRGYLTPTDAMLQESCCALLCEACAAGPAEAIRWVLATPRFRGRDLADAGVQALAAATVRYSCSTGALATAQGLAEHFGLRGGLCESDRGATIDAIACACGRGEFAAAQWLAGKSGLTGPDHEVSLADCRKPFITLARAACRAGAPDLALAVLQQAPCVYPDDLKAWNNYLLRCACEHGHLALAQWLDAAAGLTPADVCARGCPALELACRNGHLDVAQWLTARFSLTAADAGMAEFQTPRRGTGASVLEAALQSRTRADEAVARWLVQEFRPCGASLLFMAYHSHPADRKACTLGFEQWLFGALQGCRLPPGWPPAGWPHVTPKIVALNSMYAYAIADRVDIAAWIAVELEVQYETGFEPTTRATLALADAFAAGSLEGAQWLIDTFHAALPPLEKLIYAAPSLEHWLRIVERFNVDLGGCGLETQNIKALMEAVASRSFEFAQWLADRYVNADAVFGRVAAHVALKLGLPLAVVLHYNERYGFGRSNAAMLTSAAHFGRSDVVRWLLTRLGVTPDDISRALQTACARSHTKTAEVLCADPRVADDKNHSLAAAALAGNADLVRLLLARFSYLPHQRRAVALEAADHNKLDVVQALRGPGPAPAG